MKIAFFIRSLTKGGAERVAAALSTIWTDLGHEVILLSRMPPSENEYGCKCAGREVCEIGQFSRTFLRKLHDRYMFDVVVFNDALANDWFDEVFRLVGELKDVKRVVISHHPFSNWMYTLNCKCDFLKTELLKEADALVAVDAIHALWWHLRGCRALFIPNPFAVGFKRVAEYKPSHSIMWMGRIFDSCKQFNIALKVFQEVAKSDAEATFTVLGELAGNDRKRLMRQIPNFLRDRVLLKGFIARPESELSKAGLYMFTSNSEATIPQVVLETLSIGLPIVAFDIPDLGALSENDGIVKIPEGDGMVENMARVSTSLLNNPERLVTLSANALRAMEYRRSSSPTVELWGDLFSSLKNGKLDELAREKERMFVNGDTYDRMAREFWHAGAYFLKNYLPDLQAFRKWKKRLNPNYLFKCLKTKVIKLGN